MHMPLHVHAQKKNGDCFGNLRMIQFVPGSGRLLQGWEMFLYNLGRLSQYVLIPTCPNQIHILFVWEDSDGVKVNWRAAEGTRECYKQCLAKECALA